MKSLGQGVSLLDERGTTTQMFEVYLDFQTLADEWSRPNALCLSNSRPRCLRREKQDAGPEHTVQLTPLVAVTESATV